MAVPDRLFTAIAAGHFSDRLFTLASAGGAFGGSRGLQPRPPEKGVFPLDHFGECKPSKEAYLGCLKEHSGDASQCTELARRYLLCRMDRKLMVEQDLSELGFGENVGKTTSSHSPSTQAARSDTDPNDTKRRDGESREKKGFIAGSRFYSND